MRSMKLKLALVGIILLGNVHSSSARSRNGFATSIRTGISEINRAAQSLKMLESKSSVGAGMPSVRGLSPAELHRQLNLEVSKNAMTLFGDACNANYGVGKEIVVAWYKDRDGYLRYERVDDGNGTSGKVSSDMHKINQIQSKGGELLALVHNHPVGDEPVNCGAWPSNADARNLKIEQYIIDCTKDAQKKVIRLSSTDGKVYAVDLDGSEREWTLAEYKSEYGRRVLGPFMHSAVAVCEIGGQDDAHGYDPASFSKQASSARNSGSQLSSIKANKQMPMNTASFNYGPNGHKWAMKGDQPIGFDNIVFGVKRQGKNNDGFIVDLEKPYFVFNKVIVVVEDGRVRSVVFDRGFNAFVESSMQNQLASESMAIAEMIRRDIEQQCGVKLESDGRPHHRKYSWHGSGFRHFKLCVNNENDEKPGEAGFSLSCDGGYKYIAN